MENITSKENRQVLEGMKVKVYFNLHKNVFSIVALEGTNKNKVVGYANTLELQNVTFKVNESGRQRVLKEKRKNVHAYVVGYLKGLSNNSIDSSNHISYNPYKADYFYYKATNKQVNNISNALLKDKQIIEL